MQYGSVFSAPIGELLLLADEDALIGAWFFGSKYYARLLKDGAVRTQTPVLMQAEDWLERYFRFPREDPGAPPPLRLVGTPFQTAVWNALRAIPYGKTTTYGALTETVAHSLGKARLSAQATGTAVGKNPLSLFLPCHRVLKSKNRLGEYAAGADKKAFLLRWEGAVFTE